MRLIVPLFCAALFPLTLAPRIRAQGAPAEGTDALLRAIPTRAAIPLDSGLWFQREGDVLWAAGATFKASFSARCASYVPFLGSRAPRDFPLGLRLEEVSLGGVRAPLGEGGAPRLDGARVSIDRGPLLEVYQLSSQSMEQIFVLARAWTARAGDLVVRLRIEGELQARVASDGLRFEAGGLGAVRYGAASIRDARGRSAPVQTTVTGRVLELRTPAAFLAGASWPLTIDPVLTTLTIASGSQDTRYADSSYDETTQRYLVCYERKYSSSDNDIYSVEVDRDGQLIPASGAWIDVSTDDWAVPKVAGNNIANRHLVVASLIEHPSGHLSVWSRTRDAGSTAMGTKTLIATDPLFDSKWPDVGGDPHPSPPTYFCVVWTEDLGAGSYRIAYRMVDASGNPSSARAVLGSAYESAAAISKSDGKPPAATQDWTVVWERGTPGTLAIWGARIHWNGMLTQGMFPIAARAGGDFFDQEVTTIDDDPAGRKYLVIFRGQVTPGAYDMDVWVRILRGSTPLTGNINLSKLFWPADSDHQINPAADCDGCRFAVCFSSGRSPVPDDIYAATLHLAPGASPQLGISEGPVAVAASSDDERRPAICAAHSSDGSGGPRYLITWDREVAFLDFDIGAALYEGVRPGGGHSAVATGCSGLSLTAAGTPALGHAVVYRLGRTAGTPGLLVGLPAPPLTLCPRSSCQLAVLPLATLTGVSELILPLPCDPIFLGLLFAVQGFDAGSHGMGCAFGGMDLRVSDTIHTRIQ